MFEPVCRPVGGASARTSLIGCHHDDEVPGVAAIAVSVCEHLTSDSVKRSAKIGVTSGSVRHLRADGADDVIFVSVVIEVPSNARRPREGHSTHSVFSGIDFHFRSEVPDKASHPTKDLLVHCAVKHEDDVISRIHVSCEKGNSVINKLKLVNIINKSGSCTINTHTHHSGGV